MVPKYVAVQDIIKIKNKMNTFLLIFISILALNSCSSDKEGFEFSNFENTPLSNLANAVKSNDIPLINSILLNENIDINYKEPYNYQTLLSLAIVNKKKEAFVELLKFNADPNILLGPQENSSPLILAIKKT